MRSFAIVMIVLALGALGATNGGGHKTEVDVNDPSVVKAAQFAAVSMNNGQDVKDLVVVYAEKQVVNGIMFHLVFEAGFDTAYTRFEARVVHKFDGTFHLISASEVRPRGGRTAVALESEEVRNLLDFVSSSLNLVESSVVSVEQQVVAGLKYFITLQGSSDGAVVRYDVEVLQQLDGVFKLLEVHELPVHAPGSRHPAQEDDELLAVAHFASMALNGDNQVEDLRIVKAETQIVAGVMYYLTLKGTFNGSQRVYEITILKALDQTYALFEALDVTSVSGGRTTVSVDDEGVVAAAQFATTLLNGDNTSDELVIVSAETQVVAGLNYFLTISSTFAGVTKSYELRIHRGLDQSMSLIEARTVDLSVVGRI